MLIVLDDITLVLIGRTQIPLPINVILGYTATGHFSGAVKFVLDVYAACIVRPGAGLLGINLFANLYRPRTL